ncbi:uncharacterized protein SAPINGB_P000130 [Magnusiomyces paraingens]|uniref:Uncharacterized protein n=1 Tax=Magnusiomyces paraingens TaxID=2606893 RepID=A0A5E8B2A5_9ASCO|nr:uncharacterized protein SAPINGB_P000130 [Saprochaete ingens]VVT43752.1 unnamed protein product [Saprochaete ingens]
MPFPKNITKNFKQDFEKLSIDIQNASGYNGRGPNNYGTGVTKFLVCPKSCSCAHKESNKQKKCPRCDTTYNDNVESVLLSVRELFREKFKNPKVAEMEWINVNRFIKEILQKKRQNVSEHVARMMDDGYFQKANSTNKKKIIDIPMVVVVDGASVSSDTHLGYNVIEAFNLAENNLKMKAKENVTPIYVYPKSNSHIPSNETEHSNSQSHHNVNRAKDMETRFNVNIEVEDEKFMPCGVFEPLINEFISLSKFGFNVYDAFNKEEITVRAHWLYSVGDMLGVSELMGGRYPEHLRCCLRCNVFKSSLKFPAHVLVKEGRGVFNFSHKDNKYLKLRNDGIFSTDITLKDYEGGTSNDYYHSIIEPNFGSNGEILNNKYVSDKQCKDLCEYSNPRLSTFYGFKIRSPMFDYEYFSLPWSLPPNIMHAQFLDIIKLMLSIILDSNGEAVDGSRNIDLSEFRFSEKQQEAYCQFLQHLNDNTPQAFRDNIFNTNISSSKDFGITSVAQGEALLKAIYVLKDVIPKENGRERQACLLDIYSQMSVLMLYNNSTDLSDEVDMKNLEDSWETVVYAFECCVTDLYTRNAFSGTLPLHTMLHSCGYLKRLGTLRKFSFNTTKIHLETGSSHQDRENQISEFCTYMVKRYLINVIYGSFQPSKILTPATILSKEVIENNTIENNNNLKVLATQLVTNYREYRSTGLEAKNKKTPLQTDLSTVTARGITLQLDKGDENVIESPNTFYYRRFTKIKHNTSKYNLYTKTPSTDFGFNTETSPQKHENIVRVVPPRTRSSLLSCYAKLIACYSIRQPTMKKANYFAIIETIEGLIPVKNSRETLQLGKDITVGKYWVGEPKGKRRVVPIDRINNPVFVLPYVGFEVAENEFEDRYYIVDPHVFCEYTNKSRKKVELSVYRNHRYMNKEELADLREQLGDRAEEYIYRWKDSPF